VGFNDFLKRFAAGATERQDELRMRRATSRNRDYNQVVQWLCEYGDDSHKKRGQGGGDQPLVLENFASLQQQKFRAEHQVKLLDYRSDIERKLGHGNRIGATPFIYAFQRPGDGTIYCVYVLARDRQQQYVVMTPYWFLSSGETERDFMQEVRAVN
jgi:hypothetical protein